MIATLDRLRSFLDGSGVDYEVVPHRADYTAQGTASDTHTPGREFAKTVVLTTEHGFAIVVLPATQRVDLTRAAQSLDAAAQLADEEQIARLFPDCEVGAEPPFGNLYDLPVYISPALTMAGTITFNGGTHREAIRMRFDDFDRLVNPTVLPLTHRD